MHLGCKAMTRTRINFTTDRPVNFTTDVCIIKTTIAAYSVSTSSSKATSIALAQRCKKKFILVLVYSVPMPAHHKYLGISATCGFGAVIQSSDVVCLRFSVTC